MPENPEDHPPQIPLGKTTSALEEFGRLFFLPGFILRPSLCSVPAGILMLHHGVGLQSSVWYKPREYENWLDMKFLENSKVGFDTLG
jgi:hypothetical protein